MQEVNILSKFSEVAPRKDEKFRSANFRLSFFFQSLTTRTATSSDVEPAHPPKLVVFNRASPVAGDDDVCFSESFCVNDFTARYNSYKGNAYGMANTLRQTSKPAIGPQLEPIPAQR